MMNYQNTRQWTRLSPKWLGQRDRFNWSIPLFWLKNVIFIGLLFSLLGFFLLWLLDPHTLPMTTVRIEGHLVYTDPIQLKAAVSQVAMGNFLSINVAAVRLAVLKFPWIKQVQVNRQWPDTLRIQVQEHQPKVRWQKEAIIDSEGQLLSLSPSQQQAFLNLPQLTGPSGRVGEIFKRYNQLEPLVQANGWNIHEFGCNARYAWYMVLDNGVKLLFGRGEIQTRLQHFAKIYRHLLSMQKIPPVYVDLRYTNGIAVPLAPGQ